MPAICKWRHKTHDVFEWGWWFCSTSWQRGCLLAQQHNVFLCVWDQQSQNQVHFSKCKSSEQECETSHLSQTWLWQRFMQVIKGGGGGCCRERTWEGDEKPSWKSCEPNKANIRASESAAGQNGRWCSSMAQNQPTQSNSSSLLTHSLYIFMTRLTF